MSVAYLQASGGANTPRRQNQRLSITGSPSLIVERNGHTAAVGQDSGSVPRNAAQNRPSPVFPIPRAARTWSNQAVSPPVKHWRLGRTCCVRTMRLAGPAPYGGQLRVGKLTSGAGCCCGCHCLTWTPPPMADVGLGGSGVFTPSAHDCLKQYILHFGESGATLNTCRHEGLGWQQGEG